MANRSPNRPCKRLKRVLESRHILQFLGACLTAVWKKWRQKKLYIADYLTTFPVNTYTVKV